MKLSEIRTHKLFGLFDHVIPLNQEDRITIIHGPNGYGKTAVLRIVAGILQAKYSVLRSLPFEQIDLCFDNGRVLTVKKRSVADDRWPDGPETHQVVFEYAPDGQFVLPRFPRGLGREPSIRRLRAAIPDLVPLDADQWLLTTTGEVLQLDDLSDRFGEEIGGQDQPAEQPNWLTSLRESVSVRFIQANRLEIPEWAMARVGRAFTARSVVAKFARELAVRIQGTLADYAELSQSLDRSFPSRLVATPPDLKMSTEQVRTKLTDLEKKRIRLTDAGLLDKNGQSHFELPSVIDDSKIDVLSVYIRDVELKLSVLDQLFAKIDLFRSILNRRFLFKTVCINKSQGIEFLASSGETIEPTSLSSGEQQQVVLLYQLLFEVEPKSLILIDEPELSLHILWQEEFLTDLARAAELSDFDVLVATHSPHIISDRWDLTVELKGPERCSSTSPITRLQTR